MHFCWVPCAQRTEILTLVDEHEVHERARGGIAAGKRNPADRVDVMDLSGSRPPGARATPSIRPDRAAVGRAAVLGFQQTAGNRSVAALLAPRPVDSPAMPPTAPSKTESSTVTDGTPPVLDQLWRDLIGNRDQALLTVPTLDTASEARLAKMAAIYEEVTGRRPRITVRETVKPPPQSSPPDK